MSLNCRIGLVPTCTLVLLLAACGGGGSGSSEESGPSMSVDTTAIVVNATPWDAASTRSVTVTVRDLKNETLYAAISHTTTGLHAVDVVATSPSQGQVHLQFKPGSQLVNGTYGDTVTLSLCLDEQCSRQVRNSPKTIHTTLNVSGGSSVSMDATAITMTAQQRDGILPEVSRTLTVASAGPVAPHLSFSANYSAVQAISTVIHSPSSVFVNVKLKSSSSLPVGDYSETITVRACYDATCARELSGSPLQIPVSYSVRADAVPEPGVEPMSFTSRKVLAHDVIEAAYSAQLDSIVMVSSYPRSALYVYDTSTGQERELGLNRVPVSVAVSPDGTKVAVGHDALVTYADLTTIGLQGASAPKLLNISTKAFDIVLDGRGFVHVFPATDQWVGVHSVEIATNTETVTGSLLRAGSHATMHPSGDFIYTADNGLSPSDIQKYDISSGVATLLYDSPYHGDYAMCGNVWLKEDGVTIYTACGNTFRSSTIAAQDMVYSGKLELSSSPYYGYLVRSLSQSAETHEIALIESDSYNCASWQSQSNCYTRLAVYESDFLNRLSRTSIPPISVAGTNYAQHGLFIFHSSDGTHQYLISRLFSMPNPDAEYYLTTVK